MVFHYLSLVCLKIETTIVSSHYFADRGENVKAQVDDALAKNKRLRKPSQKVREVTNCETTEEVNIVDDIKESTFVICFQTQKVSAAKQLTSEAILEKNERILLSKRHL